MLENQIIYSLSKELASIGESTGYALLSGHVFPYFRLAKRVTIKNEILPWHSRTEYGYTDLIYIIGLVEANSHLTLRLGVAGDPIGLNLSQVCRDLNNLRSTTVIKLDYHDPDLFDKFKNFAVNATPFLVF